MFDVIAGEYISKVLTYDNAELLIGRRLEQLQAMGAFGVYHIDAVTTNVKPR